MDTRHTRKDGMSPIIFRLSHHRKTIAISTGFAVPPEYWNLSLGVVRFLFFGGKLLVCSWYRLFSTILRVQRQGYKFRK